MLTQLKHMKTVTRAHNQTNLWLYMYIVVHENRCLRLLIRTDSLKQMNTFNSVHFTAGYAA